jgi:hypothetical protein
LTKRARTLHLGAANYCWFTDPSQALCLKLAGTPTADRPLAGMCDSARSPQVTHHPHHRPVWAEHAEEVAQRIPRRLAPPDRFRLMGVGELGERQEILPVCLRGVRRGLADGPIRQERRKPLRATQLAVIERARHRSDDALVARRVVRGGCRV